MQTFMPYSSFVDSVRCLDYKRLGKQRVEAKQILDILLNRTDKKGWRNHPAVKMWKGYEEALKVYYNCCVQEWINREYNNTMRFEKINEIRFVWPDWMGCAVFHESHRSNLLRKSDYYKKYGWSEAKNLPYVWPIGK